MQYKYVDTSNKNLIRKSALMRVSVGTAVTTSICLLYSLAHAKYRNYPFSFVINWLKGSFVFSSLFYIGNEVLYASSNYYSVYTNFWINYTLLAYLLSKAHYRYLIRNNQMKWYLAIKYSHKCFLIFLVANLIIELILKLSKEVYLYNEKDIFDIVNEKFKDKVTGQPNFNMTYNDLEENFMKPFHLLNTQNKMKTVKKNMKTHSLYQNRGNNINNTGKKSSYLSLGFKIKTVDLFDLYKNNKM